MAQANLTRRAAFCTLVSGALAGAATATAFAAVVPSPPETDEDKIRQLLPLLTSEQRAGVRAFAETMAANRY